LPPRTGQQDDDQRRGAGDIDELIVTQAEIGDPQTVRAKQKPEQQKLPPIDEAVRLTRAPQTGRGRSRNGRCLPQLHASLIAHEFNRA
jgi:hypothetical protein